MLPIFALGAWFSCLCTVNESILLGIAKPSYAALGNSAKLVWLLLGVPLAFVNYGAFGVVMVVAISDFWRYIPVLIGQVKERISFGTQDFFVTFAGIAMLVVWELIRFLMGLGLTPV
jgi:O-antigen/teichoic acid export membrane protein